MPHARGGPRTLLPPAPCWERLLSAWCAGATPIPPELPDWGSGVPPLTPARAHSQEWPLPARRTRTGAGWPCGLNRVSRVSASAPWASVSPLDGGRGPSRPGPSPSPPPGAAGRSGSRGAGAQPAKMRPQGVLWLSRLSQAEFHARPAGPFITWALAPHSGQCSSGHDEWLQLWLEGLGERRQRSQAEAPRRGGPKGVRPPAWEGLLLHPAVPLPEQESRAGGSVHTS